VLLGAGFRTPTKLCVHGFLTVNGEKMSKSRGTFITAETYLRHLDPQYLRYYYASKLTSRIEDLDLSLDDFVNRVNADLVGKIANIPSRVLGILHQSCGGRLVALDDGGRALVAKVRARCDEAAQLYESREFHQVTRLLCDLAGDINNYLQEHKPWQLAKEDPAKAAVVCTGALNAFKVVAALIQPILPEFGRKFAQMIGVPELTWANLDEVLENRPVQPYQRLADRIDRAKAEAIVTDSKESLTAEEEVEAPALTLDPLVDCELRTMRLQEIKPVPDSEKLVLLSLEGGGEKRTVLAGLGHDATHQGLAGKNLLVLANLEPKTLRGHQSQGMLLAADVEGQAVPVVVPDGQADTVVG
jgi:methionyl-tRNA synthetase